jgi:hypothetical protein
MIILDNPPDAPRAACTPWRLPPPGSVRLTVGYVGRISDMEVPMTANGESGHFTADCGPGYLEEILWTQAASGGCWPFAAMVRNPSGSLETPLQALAFAHLAAKRDEEVEEIAGVFATLYGITDPTCVHLVVMLHRDMANDTEIGHVATYAFGAFERGFGQRVPAANKILLRTNTVNAAVTRYGHFGEITNEDVAALKAGEALPGCTFS